MNSVLHNFSLRSDNVGRLAAVMASVYDSSWKMIPHCPSLNDLYLFCLLFCKARVPHLACVLQYRSDD